MQNEDTPTAVGPAEPPLDADSLDPCEWDGYQAKQELLQLARDCGLPAKMPLDAALKTYEVFSTARSILMNIAGDAPSLLELHRDSMASLPSPLRQHAWWYVRLPDSWASRVERIAAALYLQSFCMRSENPWYVAQYLSLVACDHTGAQWSWQSPALIIDDRDVWATLTFHDDGGVYVAIECAGELTITAYPLDDCLFDRLNAGDVASFRHPLFGMTLGEVQALTRDYEDGIPPASAADMLQLRVVAAEPDSRPSYCEPGAVKHAQVPDRAPRLAYAIYPDGAIGQLPTVVNYLPPGMCSFDDWIRLTIPEDMWEQSSGGSYQVEVETVRDEHGAIDCVAVCITAGAFLYVGEIATDDDRLRHYVSEFASRGRANLALENYRNGRLIFAAVDWPEHCVPAQQSDTPRESANAPEDSVRYLEWARARATARMASLGTSVTLAMCSVVDAATWQRLDRSGGADKEGRCGGLVRIAFD
ncbi:MAG: hypothetical protein AB1761_18275 [Pseudomonadota bacterium]